MTLALVAAVLVAGGIALLTAVRSRGLRHALAHQASHDALTRLPNRTHLRQRLERELAALDTTGQCLTLMMLDLDGFKEVNDTFGHSVGDQVLIQVARRVVSSVRDADTVARLGGDEFAVLLGPGSDRDVDIEPRNHRQNGNDENATGHSERPAESACDD